MLSNESLLSRDTHQHREGAFECAILSGDEIDGLHPLYFHICLVQECTEEDSDMPDSGHLIGSAY